MDKNSSLLSEKSFDESAKISKDLASLVKIARYNQLISFYLIVIFAAVWGLLIADILQLERIWSIGVFFVFIVVTITYCYQTKKLQVINTANLLEHINRTFPYYEESAQLLLRDKNTLSLIQTIQFNKIKKLFYQDLAKGILKSSLPKINFRLPGILFFVVFTTYILSENISELLSGLYQKTDVLYESSDGKESPTPSGRRSPELVLSHVEVISPAYTGIEVDRRQELNLEVVEGSTIQWFFSAHENNLNYFFVDSENQKKKLTRDQNNNFKLTQTITQTSLYRFVYQESSELGNSSNFVSLPGVYSIAVIKDKLPKVKIVRPTKSLVEIEKNGDTQFSLEVLISDDFGITDVEILASVAKGSGEAVKFRDKKFYFDDYQVLAEGQYYKKQWSLIDLQMEPGDEVYFSVLAKDNKQPQAQQVKSSSVIVRWLDDEPVEMGAEGLQIRFVPEYFRSQRQIIIETEQLIADRKDLSKEELDDKSRDLGHSQRDLKDKYGQYLGDEVGEGPGEQFGLADGYHGGEETGSGEASAGIEKHDDHDEHDEHEEHHGRPEIGHVHEDMIDKNDRSGASELIAQFAHNHGTVEVGPMSKRDPKSWMKKAVNEMWQAELHLMLSEPEKALPYEYNAYQYLKLARQAERIYVKRLGFEPPPVKEDRRLTGELQDILNYSLDISDTIDVNSELVLIKNSHQLLSNFPITKSLNKVQLELLNQLRTHLLELAESRPALIGYAATIERILIAKKIDLKNCADCVTRLKHKLWQLLPPPVSLPANRKSTRLYEAQRVKTYFDRVKQLKQDAVERQSIEGAANE